MYYIADTTQNGFAFRCLVLPPFAAWVAYLIVYRQTPAYRGGKRTETLQYLQSLAAKSAWCRRIPCLYIPVIMLEGVTRWTQKRAHYTLFTNSVLLTYQECLQPNTINFWVFNPKNSSMNNLSS